jgi:hypothetical protein
MFKCGHLDFLQLFHFHKISEYGVKSDNEALPKIPPDIDK